MEAKEKNKTSPETFLKGMFTLPPYDTEGPHLIGGFCEQCNRKFFPLPFICPYCLNELQEVLLSDQGTLHSFAVVRVKPPFGLPLPYCLGYVDIKEDGLRVISLIDAQKIDDLEIDMDLTLRVTELGDDGKGNPCLRYMFTPKTGKQQ